MPEPPPKFEPDPDKMGPFATAQEEIARRYEIRKLLLQQAIERRDEARHRRGTAGNPRSVFDDHHPRKMGIECAHCGTAFELETELPICLKCGDTMCKTTCEHDCSNSGGMHELEL